MRRGVFGALVALVALTAVISALASETRMETAITEPQARQAALMRTESRATDCKRMLQATIERMAELKAEGRGKEAALLATKLTQATATDDSPVVKIWIGLAAQDEIDRMPSRMIAEKKTLACDRCTTIDNSVIGYDGNSTMLAALSWRDANNKTSLSRNALYEYPALAAQLSGGQIAVGCSVYDSEWGVAACAAVTEE